MSAWDELWEMGLIDRSPLPEEKKRVGRLSENDMHEDWLFQIEKGAPERLTDAARAWLAEAREAQAEMWKGIAQDRDRETKMGAYAPEIQIDIEGGTLGTAPGSASEKQLNYLRRLGVRQQDDLLSRLSKAQASELIDQVLAYRRGLGLPE